MTKMHRAKPRGWFYESMRHSLAAQGRSTYRKRRKSMLKSKILERPWEFKRYMAERNGLSSLYYDERDPALEEVNRLREKYEEPALSDKSYAKIAKERHDVELEMKSDANTFPQEGFKQKWGYYPHEMNLPASSKILPDEYAKVPVSSRNEVEAALFEDLAKPDGARNYMKRKRKHGSSDGGYLVRKKKEYIRGGRADGRPDADFDAAQLRRGIKHEMEHTGNPKIAKEIAKDHLAEDPKYYTHLDKMEKRYHAKKTFLESIGLFQKSFKKQAKAMGSEYRRYKPAKGRRVVENIHDGITFVEKGRRYSVSPENDTIADGKLGRAARPAEERFIRGAPLFVLKKHYGDRFTRED